MGIIQLILIQIKHYVKNPMLLVMAFLFPTVMLIFMFSPSHNNNPAIGIINRDISENSKELIETLEKDYEIKDLSGSIDENKDKLIANEIGAIYVIEDDFGKNIDEGIVPKVKSYCSDEANGNILSDNKITDFVQEKIQNKTVEGITDNFIETELNIRDDSKNDISETVMMICYFMMIGSSFIVGNIMSMKKQKVLQRSVVSPNKDRKIIGSIFIASFIVQAVLSSISFMVTDLVVKFKNVNPLVVLFVILICSILCTAFNIAVIRWVKNPGVANMFVMIFAIVTLLLGMSGLSFMELENVPALLSNLSYISPYYWFMTMVRGESVISGTLVLLLMSLVFFTAGTFKIRDFAKE